MRSIPYSSTAFLFLYCAWPLLAQPQPGSVLWSFDFGTGISSSPVVGNDGAIYVAAPFALYAVTNGGAVAGNKWVYPGVAVVQSPAVGSDGAIYFGDMSENQFLHAVNPDGSDRWAVSLANHVESSPAIGFDGTVYVAGGGALFAIASNGVIKWTKAGLGGKPTSPVIGRDGTVYLGYIDPLKLYAITPDGTNKWAADLYPAGAGDSPALGADDTIYVTSVGLNAFATDGSLLWQVPIQFQGRSPAVDADGTIYVVGAFNRSLYALNPSGIVKWNVLSFDNSYKQLPTAPAVDNGDTVYYCVSNSVWAISKAGQARWLTGLAPDVYFYADSAVTSPTIGPDGTIYAAIRSTLFAIAGTNPPSAGPWPMYRQNSRHTGKIEKPALVEPKRRADANFEFQLHAQLGQTNVIETTTNLNTWTSLTSIVVTTVPQPVVDLTASNHPARFYRSSAP